MLPELEQLLVLQEKDQHIRRLNAEMKKMPADAESAKTRLAGDQQAVQKAKEAVQHNEVAIKNLELQIQTRRETISRLKVQQFETRKNEEYTALVHEITRYTADVSGLEDQEIALMETAEELKATHKAAEAKLAGTQAMVDAELKQIKERYVNVKAQVKEFQEVRGGLAAAVDPDLLERYDRIFQSRGDAAVVEMEGGICRGCNMKTTVATVSAARGERVLVTCPNCSRFVYLSHFDD